MIDYSRRSLAVAGVAAMLAGKAQAQAPAAAPKGPWTEEGRIARSGMTIHYVGLGSGPPLILLHKLGGWVADWRHIAPALAKQHRVIAIDMPGHGDSVVNTPAPFIHTLAESAAAVMAALDELNIERFDLAGNSMGGCCAAVIAGVWPDRIKHLAIISSSIGEGVSREELKTLGGNNYTAEGEPIPRSVEQLAARFGNVNAEQNAEQNASRAKAGRWVLASARGVARAGTIHYLPRITAPTLLIYGEKGGYKEYEAGPRAALKRGRTAFVPDAGSFPHQDNPRETEKILLSFLSEPV